MRLLIFKTLNLDPQPQHFYSSYSMESPQKDSLCLLVLFGCSFCSFCFCCCDRASFWFRKCQCDRSVLWISRWSSHQVSLWHRKKEEETKIENIIRLLENKSLRIITNSKIHIKIQIDLISTLKMPLSTIDEKSILLRQLISIPKMSKITLKDKFTQLDGVKYFGLWCYKGVKW